MARLVIGARRPHRGGVGFPRFVIKAIFATLGAFAQVEILAHAAGVHLSQWPHVAAMTILVMPFLSFDEDMEPVTAIPMEHRGERRRQGWIGASAGFYLAVGAVALALVGLGVGPHDAGWLVGMTLIGAIPVVLQAIRVARRLRRPRVEQEPPFTGDYRTRPARPLQPDRVVPRPPAPPARTRPAWVQWLVLMLFSLLLVIGGAWMMWAAPRPGDAFTGRLCVSLFGLCAWVFGEQLVGGQPMLMGRARSRTMLVLFAACGVVLHGVWTVTDVPAYERILVGLGAAALAGFGVVGLWNVWRSARGR